MDPKTASLQDRVRAATRVDPATIVDHFTGKKNCHVFRIPVQYIEADPLQPNVQQIKTNMSFIKCIGSPCALWNEAAKECYDVSSRKADLRRADTLDAIDGHARMSVGEK